MESLTGKALFRWCWGCYRRGWSLGYMLHEFPCLFSLAGPSRVGRAYCAAVWCGGGVDPVGVSWARVRIVKKGGAA